MISTIVGTAVGSIAGYFGRWIDQLLMRVTDLFLVVPGIALAAMAQKGLQDKEFPVVGKLSTTVLMVVVLSFLFWQTIARVTRGLMLSVKEKEYVEAARVGRVEPADHRPPHHPEHGRPDRRQHHAGRRLRHPGRVDAVVPRVRHPAANVSWGNMLNSSESAVGTKTAYLIYFPACCSCSPCSR